MSFEKYFRESPAILMEGAIGERIKREFNILPDEIVALAALVYNEEAKVAMQKIFKEYIEIAAKYQLPLLVTTPTRRANKERTLKSQFDENIIADNVNFLKGIRETANAIMFIGGLMGCKGDAYKATEVLSVDEALEFHSWQVNLFKMAKVDYLFAGIMPALTEAIGMAKAMEATGIPYIISFMIRENGKLIDGTSLHDAIETIDNSTIIHPVCYMVNCVHPKVLAKALSCPFNKTDLVKNRFKGIQANTSPLTPEELDNSAELKCSNSTTLANEMVDLCNYLTPKIFGGCCGTDNIYMDEIAKQVSAKIKPV